MPSKSDLLLAAAEIFASMPPEIQAVTPAGFPPVGVVPNLDDPPTIGYHILIVGAVLLAVMLVCSGLRFYTVIAIRRQIHPDDCILSFSAIERHLLIIM